MRRACGAGSAVGPAVRRVAGRVAWLAFALAWAGCALPLSVHEGTRRAPRSGAADIVLATFNVNFGLAGDPATLEAIAGLEADVVVLQETTPEWERAIRARPDSRHPERRFVHAARWPAGGYAVLSRFPVREARTLESPVGWFDAGVAVVGTPRGDVQILTVHLRPPVIDEGAWLQGWFHAPAVHRREVERFVAALDHRVPTLIAGDFNEPEGRGALRWLAERGYGNALPLFEPAATTWRWPLGPLTLRERFDHVVYQGTRFECLRAGALDVGRSDHIPVVAAFRLIHRVAPARAD